MNQRNILLLLIFLLPLACDQALDDFKEPRDIATSSIWQNLADYMGISINKEDPSASIALLEQVPSSTDPSHPNYTAIKTGVETAIIGNAFKGQCHSIVGIRELPTKDGNSVTLQATLDGSFSEVSTAGKVYILKYKLRNADGSEDSTVRSAIVTRPDSIDESTGLPLLLYSHTGTSGTTYTEIVGAIGGMQGSNIVAAPVFPGEPLCKSVVATPNVRDCGGTDNMIIPASGSVEIFNNDVLDLMGLHACLTGTIRGLATIKQLDATFNAASETDVSNPFVDSSSTQSKFATHIAGTTSSGVKTLIIGSGRGGRVALLAGARAGVVMTDYGKSSEGNSVLVNAAGQIDGFTFVPPTFSAIATLSAPVSGLMGIERVATEHAVSQTLSSSIYASIPGMADLQQTMSGLAEGTTTTEQAAITLALQDLIYMGAYLAAGVQNWSAYSSSGTAKEGAIMLAHSTNDLVVNIGQLATGFNVIGTIDNLTSTAGSPLEAAPGFHYLALAFQPTSDYADFCTTDPSKLCMTSSTDYNHSLMPSVLTARLANLSSENLEVAQYELGSSSEAGVSALANGLFQSSGEVTGFHRNIVRSFLVYRTATHDSSFATRSANFSTESAPKSYYLPPVTPGIAIGLWYAIHISSGGSLSAS